MKAIRLHLFATAVCLLLAAATANAATFTGTVTNKTTGKPVAGDPVVLVDVQASMSEVAHATTDTQGRYSLTGPGTGPYLIRVTHQGAGYFIAAQEGVTGNIPVYDVAAKVDGVFAEAAVYEIESDNGQLRVTERYFIHNTSSPPRTEWTPRTFEVVLPAEATIVGAAAQRPTGLPTSVKLDPTGTKGHYAFNFPIQPDEGEKNTLFQIEYTLPYSDSKFTFHPQVTLPTQSVGVLLPKGMSFTPGPGLVFQPVQQDPNIQTFVGRSAAPGKPIEFTVSGTGAMPREAQGAGQGEAAQASGAPTSQPGGGIGEPINTPDPLSKYKWWILGGLALLLAAAAAFLLRKPAGLPAATAMGSAAQPVTTPTAGFTGYATPTAKNAALLNALKEELFSLETEKLNGTLSPEEYAEVKPALEVVLKRALKRQSN